MYTDDQNDAIDMHDKFNVVLLLFFVEWGVGIANGVIAFMGCRGIANSLALLQLANLAGFIMLHIYRFKAAGQFCSGQFNPSN